MLHTGSWSSVAGSTSSRDAAWCAELMASSSSSSSSSGVSYRWPGCGCLTDRRVRLTMGDGDCLPSPFGNEWCLLSAGLLDTRVGYFGGVFAAPAETSRLYRTFCSALSSSAKPGSVDGLAARGAMAWASGIDCLLLVVGHGAQPALASTSASLGDMGPWWRPDSLLARLRRCEKKLSRELLVGDFSPVCPLSARSASCRWMSA